ncbi:hypothetical protein [Streptomyces sp900116325]|uniref:hypothetical protein n=1 Tax=Streptomyces sp. 900116325 TaxID=3154295 RepID=UPI0033D9A273
MTPEQASARAALLLIGRLVKNHGLTVEEATTAVGQRRRRETGPHTHLVLAEAHDVLTEAMAPIRALADAMAPMVRAATAAMSEIVSTLRQPATQQTTTANRDRPTWATPYGPPPSRRFP